MKKTARIVASEGQVFRITRRKITASAIAHVWGPVQLIGVSYTPGDLPLSGIWAEGG
jgi:hypothetical protein